MCEKVDRVLERVVEVSEQETPAPMLAFYNETILDFINRYIEIAPVERKITIPFKTIFQEFKKFAIVNNQRPLTYKEFRREFQGVFLELNRDIAIFKINNTWQTKNIQLIDKTKITQTYNKFSYE